MAKNHKTRSLFCLPKNPLLAGKENGIDSQEKDRLSIPSLSSIGNHWKAIPLPLLSPPSDPKNQTFLIDSLFLRDNRFSPTITKIMRTFLLKMGLFPDKQEFTAHNGLGTHSLERDFPYCNTPLNLSSLEHGLETIFFVPAQPNKKSSAITVHIMKSNHVKCFICSNASNPLKQSWM